MYSIAKIHYTTITTNKEGAAHFVKKKKIYIYSIYVDVFQREFNVGRR